MHLLLLLQPINLSRPILSLLKIYALWKSLLLLIAIATPGPGYDTSTSLLVQHDGSQTSGSSIVDLVTGKLNRWDAIYFTHIAERGYLFEQEWAFGWGWTGLIGLLTAGFSQVEIFGNHDGDLRYQSLVGIVLAHLSHVLSVVVLYHFSSSIIVSSPPSSGEGKKFAFVAACLHIFSPAGLFLSAPYAESTFALLSFSGYYLFLHSGAAAVSSVWKDASLVVAGGLFGLSTTVRSNGLLNGIIFLQEAVKALFSFRVQRLLAAGLGGALVGTGFLLPQFIAYQHFCVDTTSDVGATRQWCTKTVPSIYTFVQAHYWNSGFLRYWTISNIPLFLLALPMLSILGLSSLWGLKHPFHLSESKSGMKEKLQDSDAAKMRVLKTMAFIQVILGFMTFLNAHVQIVTRLASGYPVWYWYVASKITANQPKTPILSSKWIIRWMVMYAIIQGALFASFLPPA